MGELEVLQRGDFEGIFEAMDGLPVVIRLIDPPLHEFLPSHEELIEQVTRFDATGTPEDDPAYAEARTLLAAVSRLREQNPMLGLRGCRLGLMIPDFVKIQTRAILEAAIARKKAGGDPAREDHDPARRPRERAGETTPDPRGRGGCRRRPGRRRASTTSSGR